MSPIFPIRLALELDPIGVVEALETLIVHIKAGTAIPLAVNVDEGANESLTLIYRNVTR